MATKKPGIHISVVPIVVAFVGTVAVAIGLTFVRDSTLETIDQVHIKAIIIFASFCILLWASMLLALAFWIRPGARLTQTIFNATLATGTVIAGGASLGIFFSVEGALGESGAYEWGLNASEVSPLAAFFLTIVLLLFTVPVHLKARREDLEYDRSLEQQ